MTDLVPIPSFFNVASKSNKVCSLCCACATSTRACPINSCICLVRSTGWVVVGFWLVVVLLVLLLCGSLVGWVLLWWLTPDLNNEETMDGKAGG